MENLNNANIIKYDRIEGTCYRYHLYEKLMEMHRMLNVDAKSMHLCDIHAFCSIFDFDFYSHLVDIWNVMCRAVDSDWMHCIYVNAHFTDHECYQIAL